MHCARAGDGDRQSADRRRTQCVRIERLRLVAGGRDRPGRLSDRLFQPTAELDLVDYVLLEVLSDVLGGDVVNLINLCVAEDLQLDARQNGRFSLPRLTGGETMVNDNQISLQAHSPELPFTLSAVMLLSLDDLSFCDNQSEVENEVRFALTNVLALSASLRVQTATVSRNASMPGSCRRSRSH